MRIRQLPETLINQIAAGEVIERPASVVKELIENALDAGARTINITTAGGGITLIRVTDDGCGIPEEELTLALGRHCTSKLSDTVMNITSLGFRGEALASIGSVSRLILRSRTSLSQNGAEILLENGTIHDVRPAACNCGTTVEVRDLFFSTPARLKFMKEERFEAAAITDVVKKLALAFPSVRFTLSGADRSSLDLHAAEDTPQGHAQRIVQIIGDDFALNSLPLEASKNDLFLKGHISMPQFNRSISSYQHFFVNGRPIRDKLIAASIRSAYTDLLPRDRHPIVALFLSIDPESVDVNVHPAKADVRFRNPALIRRFIITSLQETLNRSGIRPFPITTAGITEAFKIEKKDPKTEHLNPNRLSQRGFPLSSFSQSARSKSFSQTQAESLYRPLFLAEAENDFSSHSYFAETPPATSETLDEPSPPPPPSFPLGIARAQIHENYIIAQTQDSMIIVDQHAAHERLVYEMLKNSLESHAIPSQMLLSPEIVELSEHDAEKLLAHSHILQRLGLILEAFGPGAIAVREIPALFSNIDLQKIIRDLIDELHENETLETLKKRVHEVASKIACHGSIRSGRRLKIEEMNALLRQMETVSNTSTCNHGRPTYIELTLADIEKLFSRR